MAIKVLIVDDSAVFREAIARGIGMDPDIQVIATAADPYEARDKILEYDPDVVTCDIEMPKMSGIEFVKRLMPQYPVPVIVVSSISDKVFDAMNAGAVEFVSKPSAKSPQDVQKFIKDLVMAIKAASKASVHVEDKSNQAKKHAVVAKEIKDFDLIAIGASTGGTEAIYELLKQLPDQSATLLPGIVIVQHIPPVFSRMFAERLDKQTNFQVKEAANGDFILPGHIYVAPGDKHVQVKRSEKGLYLRVFEGEKVNGHCPSVDVMFHSVAECLGNRVVGVILTGMGYDGAKGIAAMRRKGAITVGQDEKTCVVYGMPKVAYELNGITKQCGLDIMGSIIMQYLK